MINAMRLTNGGDFGFAWPMCAGSEQHADDPTENRIEDLNERPDEMALFFGQLGYTWTWSCNSWPVWGLVRE